LCLGGTCFSIQWANTSWYLSLIFLKYVVLIPWRAMLWPGVVTWFDITCIFVGMCPVTFLHFPMFSWEIGVLWSHTQCVLNISLFIVVWFIYIYYYVYDRFLNKHCLDWFLPHILWHLSNMTCKQLVFIFKIEKKTCLVGLALLLTTLRAHLRM